MKDYHQIHNKIYYTSQVLTRPITLICPSVGGKLGYTIGEKVSVRVEEFDWGQSYTAFSVANEKVYLSTKTIGIVPEVTDREMEQEILKYVLTLEN